MKAREIIKELETDGWCQVRFRGSHRQFHHQTKPGAVTVSGRSSKDLPKEIPAGIVRQAGLGRRIRWLNTPSLSNMQEPILPRMCQICPVASVRQTR
ncbi:MAG: addiction module toxin, HicA family [Acidimicrobiaceae bacterium]|nr:addiction module toxin, HicA family [Acidimicrobiaceae bacterium]